MKLYIEECVECPLKKELVKTLDCMGCKHLSKIDRGFQIIWCIFDKEGAKK